MECLPQMHLSKTDPPYSFYAIIKNNYIILSRINHMSKSDLQMSLYHIQIRMASKECTNAVSYSLTE